ncbi:MAG: lytic transglycosylase domain-containing protein [Gammaproteobacteria bacterium]|nr:lytic transglycosylase domain-containing protein [Gammaproteobacteria bacterium]
MSDKAALRHGVDPMLLRALVARESSWNPRAVSPKGAAGLTQLMPATAKHECGLLPEAIFEPARNLDCGARYFAKQLRRFKSVELALAAYNSGPARVARLGRVPRIRETQQYVSHIMADWNNKEAI